MPRLDVEQFLTTLGIDGIDPVGDETWFLCPFHGDRHTSASMRQDGLWFCFVCHKGGTLITFLADYADVSPIEAARRIREMSDLVPPVRLDGSLLAEVDRYFARARTHGVPAREKEIIANWHKAFSVDWDMALVYLSMGGDVGDLAYPFARGFVPTTLSDYDIGYDVLTRRLVITLRDYDGEIVGFKGRDISGSSSAKYMVLGGPTYGFAPVSVGDHVYLLDSCDTQAPIILCEGELNALMLRQYGYDSAVAISGSYITQRQVGQILTKARREIILFFDGDQAGQLGADRAARMLEGTLRVLVVGDHDNDPATMEYDEIEELLKCSKSSLTF